MKWTPAAVKSLLRRIEPRFSTMHLFDIRELVTKQIIRDRFVSWGYDIPRIAKSLNVTEEEVYGTLRDVARKARV